MMHEMNNNSCMYHQIEFSGFSFFSCVMNRIQVQLDGNEYGVGQQGARIPVNVFQSTTIRELRALVNKNIVS
jgi:hypothetical protein